MLSIASRQLVLLLPGLCGPDSDPPVSDYLVPRPAALDRLLSRSTAANTGNHGLDASLCRWFGVNVTAPQTPPVAPLTYCVDTGQAATGYILRADPVHLRADQSVLRLFDASTFSVTQREADELTATFNTFYAGQRLQLLAPCPQRWYLQLERAPRITTTELARVAGQDIDNCLPQGADTAHWHRLLNEVQMLFHEHAVNLQRQQQGEPPINSLWFWGGGTLPATAQDTVTVIATDQVTGLGLAQQAGTPRFDVPAGLSELLPLTTDGVTLVVINTLAAATRYGDVDRWLQLLRELEPHWFAPLPGALKQGKLDALEIDPCNGTRFQLTRRQLQYFWKRDHPFERRCRND
jgi:hypothetical protein